MSFDITQTLEKQDKKIFKKAKSGKRSLRQAPGSFYQLSGEKLVTSVKF